MVTGVAAGVAVVLLGATVLLAMHARSLDDRLTAAREREAAATAETARLKTELDATATDLSAQRELIEELQQQVKGLSDAAGGVAPATQPRRVRLYRGTQYVGGGWLLAPRPDTGGAGGAGMAVDVAVDGVSAAAQPGDPAGNLPGAGASGVSSASAFAFTTTYSPYGYIWPYIGWGPGWNTNSIPPDPPPSPVSPAPAGSTAPAATPSVAPQTTARQMSFANLRSALSTQPQSGWGSRQVASPAASLPARTRLGSPTAVGASTILQPPVPVPSSRRVSPLASPLSLPARTRR